MKQLSAFLVLLIVLLSTPSHAGSYYTPGNNGFGISVGDFGGLTLYHKLSDQNFIQGFISRDLIIGGDYAISFPNAIPSAPAVLPYVGGGGFLFSTRYWSVYEERGRRLSGVGARIPLGAQLQIPNAPIHLHGELTPTCTITPFVESFLAVQIGVRFVF